MPFPVDWSDIITDDEQARTRSLYDRNGDVFLVIHHAYNYTVYQTIATFKSTSRTVSANFAIGPTTSGGQIAKVVRTVPEHRRAYTTASSIDDKALTVETSNINLNAPFPVALDAKRKLAQLAAYMHREYKMPLDRWHVTSHQEVYKRGWGSYATACPGGDLQASLDWIVAEAKRIVASSPAGGGTTPIEEADVATFKQFQNTTDFTVRSQWQDFPVSTGSTDTNFAAGTGGEGLYDIILNLYFKNFKIGQVEGKVVDVTAATGARSDSFTFTVEPSESGVVKASIPARTPVDAGTKLVLSLRNVGIGVEDGPGAEPILENLGISVANLKVG